MRPPLAPVEARPAERTAALSSVVKTDAEPGQKFFAGTGHHTAVIGEHNVLVVRECVSKRHAETAGNVVITGPSGAQLIVAVPARPITLPPSAATTMMLSIMRATFGDESRKYECRPCLVSASRFASRSLARCSLVVCGDTPAA